jgi:hypothetical protein
MLGNKGEARRHWRDVTQCEGGNDEAEELLRNLFHELQ